MEWFMPRRSRSFAGSQGRRFPRRGGGPSRAPARAVLLLLVMVAALAPRAFAQTTPSPGARWTPGGVWTHDVTTTSLIGKLMLQQSVTITGGSMIWDTVAIDACPWRKVTPPLPSASCESLKGYGAIPGQPFRNNPLTVANFAPTQAMIDNGGVVIRLRWQGFSSPAGGNVGMTEWVPLEPPATNATLVLTPAAISENAGVSTVTATLNRTTSAATTITVSAAAVAPAVSGDFTLSSTQTLTIAANATTSTGTVTITASDNSMDAPNKSVTVSGTATGEVGNPSDVTLTIEDDDDPPTLSIDSPSMTEGDSGTATLTFTMTLSAASGQQVTVGYADAGTGTATSGTDYTAITAGTLTFAAGTTSQTIAVTVAGDTLDEADETIALTLSNPANATLATATATGTVTDDDAMPTLAINSPSEAEGTGATGGTLTFTVTLSAASGRQVTVDYVDAGTGTATSGTDYTAITGGTLTFAAGTTTQTIDVTVAGDTLDEADETIALTLSNPANATLATATATGTVTDDDAMPTLAINSPSEAEGTGATGGTLTFTVTLSAASGRQVTVDYVDAGTGTATSGTDYTAITGGTLTFAAGTTTQTIDVTVTGDATDEADETVVVTLSAPANATLATAAGTGTVTDDDDAPTVSIDSPSVTEGTGATGGTLRFLVSLSAASGKQVTVDYADAGSGTATSGTDYTALTAGTLTFAAGTTTRTLDVTVTGDATDEADETVAVTLSGPVNATLGLAAGTGTVSDDDEAPTLSIDAPSMTEGDSGTATLTFTVTLNAASGRQVSVAYAHTGGTATSGTDYTALSAGRLTFAAGTTTQTIDVTVTGDATDEADETVVVTLSAPANATLATAAGTGTVTDDDDAPTVSIDSPSVTEGTGATGGTLRFLVSLSAASGKQVTVDYADAGSGTATSGTDYTALTPGTLTFAAGTTTQAIAVTVTGDATDEADETVAVTLSGPVNATLGLAASTGTVSDDDEAPTLSIDAPRVVEGAAGATPTLRFTVSLSAASGRQVTVAYADAGSSGTATSGTDYTALAAGTLTFAAGTTTQTIDVTVTGDTTDEQDETIAVTLSGPTNATLASGAATETGTGTVVDDDGTTPTLFIDAPSVAEGAPGATPTLTFTVTLSPASTQTVTVDYADAGSGTATSGTDYTALTPGTLTFAAGTTTQAIAVTVTGDATDEADETVAVTLSGPVNATLGLAAGTGTVTDDDAPPTVSIDSPSVAEGTGATGGTLTFTVSLSAASGKRVTVGYARTGGTTTAGADYTALAAGTLTFAAGETSRTIDVTVIGDVADEPDETVAVTLSAPVNASIAPGAGTGTGTVTDDDDAPTLSIDSPRVTEGAPGTAAALRFTVSLSAASGRQVTVDYADAGTGTATSGHDYAVLAAGTLTFAPGTTTRTLRVSVTGDAEEEADETIVVTLSAPMNATLAAATGTGTLTAAPPPPPAPPPAPPPPSLPSLSIDAPRVVEGAPGTTATLRFTVTLSRTSTRTVTVAYADAGTGTAIAGAADAQGADYTAIPAGTLTFAPGTATRTIDVTVIGDAEEESDETVAVTLSAPVNATLAAASGTGTIADDDAALRVGTDRPGTTTRTVNGHTVTVVVGDGVPAGVVVLLPVALDRDVALRFAPPAPGVPFESARFGLGETPDRRTVVDVTAQPVPPGGLELCLPVAASLRAEAGERGLRLLHYGEAGWTAVARSRDDAARGLVCASGVTELSPFAVGYDDLTPTFGDAQVPAQRYVQGLEIAPLVLPAATGGDGPLAYALAPALPEGLAYTAPTDATSGGALAGAPAVPAQAVAWTLTATDADGDTATLTFTVEVVSDLRPSFGGAQVPPQRYVQDLEIDPLALPAATGGNGPLAYALAPALPEGLAYTAPTDATSGGALAGTPTVPAQAAAWTLTATDADGDRATLRFTIEVLDRLRVRLRGINEALLPDLSRAMTASTMDAVSGRIGQALSPGGAGAMAPADVLTGFAGLLQANEQALEDGTWSWKQGLDGRRFALALSGAGGRDSAGGGAATGLGAGPATGAGARVTVWGAGDYRSLAGGEGSAVDWDGHLFGAHLGMDARFGAGGLAGLALSASKGRFDYTDTSAYALGGTVEGEYESRMTSAHPYVGWAWPAGRHAWASLGYGRGDVTLLDGEAGRHTSDSTLRSAAAGGSVRVLSGEGPGVFGPMTVDLKGEAQTTRLEVEDNGDHIAGLAVRTHRLRVAAEGARAFALSGGAAFTPSVELGMRLDGGDGETGAGMELGGGLDYAHPALGLSADVAGRVLLAHEGATEDWSVGGAVRLEPATGLGLSLRLAPSYGDTGSGLSRLWEGGVAGSGAGATGAGTTGASPAARLDTEMGYGLAAFAGVLTPYGGLGLSEGGTRGYRLGARFLLGPAFELDLEGERRESRTERPGYGLMLRGRVRW